MKLLALAIYNRSGDCAPPCPAKVVQVLVWSQCLLWNQFFVFPWKLVPERHQHFGGLEQSTTYISGYTVTKD